MADACDRTMGRCILDLYRSAVQPAMVELGDAVAAANHPRGLILDPTGDAFVPTELVPAVAERLGATHVRLEGRHHWWMTQDPAPAADALMAHWRSGAPRP